MKEGMDDIRIKEWRAALKEEWTNGATVIGVDVEFVRHKLKRWMENLFDIKGVIIIYFQLLPGHKDPDHSDPILKTTFRQESLRMTPELCARLSWGKTMTFARLRDIPFLTAWVSSRLGDSQPATARCFCPNQRTAVNHLQRRDALREMALRFVKFGTIE